MKLILSILFVTTSFHILAQKHCKCSSDEISNWNNRNHGLNEKVLKGQPEFQHPVTSFYRKQGSWYNSDSSQIDNLKNLRGVHRNARSNKDYREIYSIIYNQSNNASHLYYDPVENKGHNNYTAARTAKDAAFILLMDFDNNGNNLNNRSEFKDVAVDALYMRQYEDYYKIPAKYVASNLYRGCKRLMTFLQAYDYLMAEVLR